MIKNGKRKFNFDLHAAYAITPVDGRYASKTKALAPFFSEAALMRYRTLVECEFFIFLFNSNILEKLRIRKLSVKEVEIVRALYKDFSSVSVTWIKEKEATTNHDVKAVEYFIKEKLSKTTLKDLVEWVHFGLTSEDTNNTAYALMLSHAVQTVIVSELTAIKNELGMFARDNAKVAMLARTHGQSASPTTLGKEFKVFESRLMRQLTQLTKFKVSAKLNGATGNYNALVAAFPKTNWVKFTEGFIAHLSKTTGAALEANILTTQIEPHDTYAELFDTIRRANTILMDLSQDVWRYISDGYLGQKTKAGEVGSSTMPHKVNPIDFENAEGNFGIANALGDFFSRKLPISRLQRDLSDSTVERSFGTAFAHSLIAYQSLLKGLGKISVNKIKIAEDLASHPEVLAEAIQTVLRREGIATPYEKLKELTRGKIVTMEDFKNFINGLNISPKLKKELHAFTPENYIGIADMLARGKQKSHPSATANG